MTLEDKIKELEQRYDESKMVFGEYEYSFRLHDEMKKCIFFDGKTFKAIDNLPDDPEIKKRCADSLQKLPYWHNKLVIEFLKDITSKKRHDRDYMIKKMDYTWPTTDKEVAAYLKDTTGLSFENGEAHLIADESGDNVMAASWYFINKFKQDHFQNEPAADYNKLRKTKKFTVPKEIKEYVEFNGTEYVKKENFPEKLNVVYNDYVLSLRTVFYLYEWDFIQHSLNNGIQLSHYGR